jgi:hypothetical protein
VRLRRRYDAAHEKRGEDDDPEEELAWADRHRQEHAHRR